MKFSRAVAFALACFCAACSVQQAAPDSAATPAGNGAAAGAAPQYTARERGNLFGCSVLTDSAMIIAQLKQKGVPLQDVKGFYANRPNAQLTLATADRVYDDQVGNVWDYAVTFFDDCAVRVAQLPRERTGPASFCMLNSMIAANAQASHEAGVPIEQVQQYFSRFPGDLPKSIVAQVYSQTQTRAEAQAQAWNACIGPISGG